MTPQTITLTHLPDILLVVLPDGAQGFGITDHNDLGWCIPIWNHQAQDWDWDGDVVNLPAGNWQIVGRLSEVTEDDIADLTGHYYNKYNERYVDFLNSSTRVTPIDDLESAILAERYYFDNNPVPPFQERLNDWIEAQSRVLSRERLLLLRRMDG